jgi:hypothetical protein
MTFSILYLIIFILLVIIIFYIVVQKTAPDLQYYVHYNESSINWKTLDYVLKNADNGDLVFMSGDTYGERSCRYFTNCMYSHVGMLFREKHPKTKEDILYIWDSDLGQQTKDGPRVQKFIDKINKYHGYPYFMWRQLKVSEGTHKPSTDNILKIVRQYGNYNFDNKMWSWWFSDIPFFYNLVKKQNKMFCSELIAATMQNKSINMMTTENLASWYSPKSFTKNTIFGLKDGYSYSEDTFVKFEKEK